MSVASHLRVSPPEYDKRIRKLIPLYDELIAEAAEALGVARRPVREIVDLGVGTGALTVACLRVAPQAHVVGLDADAAMMEMAPVRLGRLRQRLRLVHGDFTKAALPECDAMVASYALHHIRTRRAKQAFYKRCHAALRAGGVLISGDCAPAMPGPAFERDLEVWFTHLGKTYGRAKGKRVYESWADEDVYVPLMDEIRMLERAGFTVEVPWRRSPFAVIAAVK